MFPPAIVLFLTVLGWMIFLTQGLVIGDLDDWDHILFAQDIPWKVLFENILRPWSESPFWYGQGSFQDHVIHERVFPTFFLKLITSIFDLRPFAFYFFYKALIFAGVIMLLYILLKKITANTRLAFGACIFYALIPAHYFHTLWISDPILIVYFCVLLSLVIFLGMLEHYDSSKTFYVRAALFFIFGWIGMKSKSPALILPLVLSVYWMFRNDLWKRSKFKYLFLFSIFVLLAFQVVPIRYLGNSDSSLSFKINLENIRKMTLFNNHSILQDEPAPALFCLRHIFPTSIARSLGFFSLWMLIIHFCTYWIYRWKGKLLRQNHLLRNNVCLLASIWLAIEITLMGLFYPEPRFLSGSLIPTTILCTALIDRVVKNTAPVLKRIFLFLVILAFVWNGLVENFQHVIWLRIQKGKLYIQFLDLAQTVYIDHYKTTPSMRDLALFYNLMYIPDSWLSKTRMEDLMFHTDLSFQDWSQTASGSIKEYEVYAQKGFLYYAHSSKELFDSEKRVVLLKEIQGINEKSWMEQLTYKLKRKPPRPMYLFKWVSDFK